MSILSRSRGEGEPEEEGKLSASAAAEGHARAGGEPGNGPPEMSSEQLLVAVEVDERGVPRPLDNPTSFRVIRLLGEGGMGVVYLAMQTYPQRMVALKVLKTSVRQEAMRRRFAREISALAKLQHRGITQLLSAGSVQTTLGVQPFLTMEYIEGIPLTDYTVRAKLEVDDKLRLFLKVCDAVSHAHRRGIVHRDLSPKNILVTEDGEPHVLDFGLAAMREDAARSGVTTVDGQVLGTLNYMSPEQARGSGKGGSREQDERTDVYALGVILFEMLTGNRPILRGESTLMEALERLANEEPLRASSIDRRFRGDIDTIAQKAIERDLAHRYATVAAMAGDIVRFLKHEPILARRPSAAYRARKFVQRHKVMVGATAAVIAALTVGLVAAVREANRANRQERETALKLADAQVSQGDALLMMERRDEARDLYNTAWDEYERLGMPALAAKLGVWDVDRRSWHRVATLKMYPEGVEQSTYGPTLSPDGLLIAAADGQGHVAVRAVADWHVVFATNRSIGAEHVTFSNDSRLCAVRWTGDNVMIWDTQTGKLVREEAAGEKVMLDNQELAISGAEGYVAIMKSQSREVYWGKVQGGQALEKLEDSKGTQCAAFDKSGELVIVSTLGRLARFSPANRTLRQVRASETVTGMRHQLLPDGETMLAADQKQITLVDTRTGDVIRRLPMANADRTAVFGDSLLWEEVGRESHLYDLEGHMLNGLPGFRQRWTIAGRLAARTAERGVLELWSIGDHMGVTEMGVKPDQQGTGALSGDGKIAVITSGKAFYVLDAETGRMLRQLEMANIAVSVRFSPDALHVYAALGDGSMDTWDVRNDVLKHDGPMGESAMLVGFDEGGRFAVWDSGDGNHHEGSVVNLESGVKRALPGTSYFMNGGAVSSDGRRLVASTETCELVMRDLANGGKELWHQWIGPDDAQVWPVFAMNDQYVVSGRNSKEVCVFDAATGKVVSTVVRTGPKLASLQMAGEFYVLAYDRQNLTIYDMRDFRRIRLLETGNDLDEAMAATPDANELLLVNAHGRAVVYDFGHAEEARALEKKERAAGVDLAEAFALYGLDRQFTAGLSGRGPAAGSRAQGIAGRRLGLATGGATDGDGAILAGTRILRERMRQAVTTAGKGH